MRQVQVRVRAGSSKNQVIEKGDNRFEIHTRFPREQGKANNSSLELLAEYLDIDVSRIRLVKGQTQPNKLFTIL